MISHSKEEILKSVEPVERRTLVPMSRAEIQCYNTITSVARMNLLLCEKLEGRTTSKTDSLLNSSQAKFARSIGTNIQLACCGGGEIVPALGNVSFNETLDFVSNGVEYGGVRIGDRRGSDAEVARCRKWLNEVQMGGMRKCQGCYAEFQVLLLTPCVHFFCPDCVASEHKPVSQYTLACSYCREEYDIDSLQALQPGFDTRWKWNVEEELAELKAKKARDDAIAN
ncbi:hypothetical protein TeGR_g7187, partial [Tetraparma gracilis]